MLNQDEIVWEKDPRIFIFQDELAGKHKMHVKNLNLHDWVRIDNTYMDQMKAKEKLYANNLSDIFVTRKNDCTTDECKWEFFEILINHLLVRYPTFFELLEDGEHIQNKLTGCTVSIRQDDVEDLLLRAGRLTQDDWIILQYDPNQLMYVLTAGILCFPSNWDITEKFDKPMNTIHIPVKPYMDHLKDKVNALFERIKPDNPMWRANWGIYGPLESINDLFLHPKRQLHKSDGETEGSVIMPFEGELTGRKLFLRCEYQTIRKLPKTECIVFGVRTYQRYLEDLKHDSKEVAESLLTSIENLDDVYLSYKGGDVWKEAAVKYLNLILREKEIEKEDSAKADSIQSIFPLPVKTLGIVILGVSCLLLWHKIKKL